MFLFPLVSEFQNDLVHFFLKKCNVRMFEEMNKLNTRKNTLTQLEFVTVDTFLSIDWLFRPVFVQKLF